MSRFTKVMLVTFAVVGLLAPAATVLAQTTKVTEEAQIEVLRVLGGGQTVIIRNLSTLEVHKYDKIPKNASVTINGQPGKLSDLREGMRLNGLRIEGVTDTPMSSAEVSSITSTAPAPAAAPAAAPAPAPAAAPAAAPADEPAAAEPAKELPHTASPLPLVAFAGLALLAAGAALGVRRRRSN